MRIDVYNRYRRQGFPASQALLIARGAERELELDWNGNGDVATLERDGFAVRLEVKPDYDSSSDETFTDSTPATYERFYRTPDYDVWLGNYAEELEHGGWAPRQDFYRYVEPMSGTLEERWNAYRRSYSRHDAYRRACEELRRDVEHACEPVERYGVVITVSRAGVELGGSSLYGIELGAGPDNESELEELVDDYGMISEALEQAREKLEELERAGRTPAAIVEERSRSFLEECWSTMGLLSCEHGARALYAAAPHPVDDYLELERAG